MSLQHTSIVIIVDISDLDWDSKKPLKESFETSKERSARLDVCGCMNLPGNTLVMVYKGQLIRDIV